MSEKCSIRLKSGLTGVRVDGDAVGVGCRCETAAPKLLQLAPKNCYIWRVAIGYALVLELRKLNNKRRVPRLSVQQGGGRIVLDGGGATAGQDGGPVGA